VHATRRSDANDGVRNTDVECFLSSSGTVPLHAAPLLRHQNQSMCRQTLTITGSWRDIVAVILPVSPSRAGEAIQSLQTVGIASPLPLRSLR
jgi:hypothetical protein